MSSLGESNTEFEPTTPVNPRRALALALLADAHDVARDTGGNLWDFAVEISSFLGAGLTVNDLRWLSAKGYLEHAVESTHIHDPSRTFQPTSNLSFLQRTCFVVTEAGLRAARGTTDSLHQREQLNATTGLIRCYPPVPEIEAPGHALIPTWDRDRRVLWLRESVVKRFRVPSPSQETILVAFEEEGWPTAIDDPLPPQPGQVPKRRLRATLQSLNRGQAHHLIRFRGDGSGERIVWELANVANRRSAPLEITHRRAA